MEENPATAMNQSPAPVSEASRIKLIDALRGVALLGILLMNIPGFSMAQYSSEAYRNDPANVNFWVSAVISIFFEGKMRAMFGMIFGAGVLLFVMRKEDKGKSITLPFCFSMLFFLISCTLVYHFQEQLSKFVIAIGTYPILISLLVLVIGPGVFLAVYSSRTQSKSTSLLFFRRMYFLLVFGLIHAHLILWIGDILYLYAICGMIVFLCRKIKPKYLVLAVPLVALVDFTSNVVLYKYVRNIRIAYVDALAVEKTGGTLSDAQRESIKQWKAIEKEFIPNREKAKENTQKMKSDYGTVANYLRPKAFKGQTYFIPMEIWDSVALMFLGLALYQWGFLSGQWSRSAYWKTLLLGYGIGLPLVTYNFYHNYLTHPNMEAMLARMEQVPIEWTGMIYPFQRILLVLAHVSSLVLLYQAGVGRVLFRCLEAVGQMAFTNYIMHSVICTLFFFGYGLNYFGELQLYQIYFVALAIWAVQLILSPLWLKYFLFGPLEWLWRSLTYWKLQPFVRT